MTSVIRSREGLLIMAIAAVVALVSIRFPSFAAPSNLKFIVNDTSILIMLALGQMVVIATRCIDLSVASNLALSGMVVATINMMAPDLPIPVLLLIALALGMALGAFNGFFVSKLDIPPIVVTLGTLTIYRGIIFLISDGAWINAHEMSPAFKAFPRAELLGIPVLSWFMVAVVSLFTILVYRTGLGRAFFAVGGNPNAAVYTGIDVGRTRFAAFVISGGIAGLCGYLWVSRYAVAYVDIAAGFELEVVAACVIGGISIAGGIGSVGGAVLGALFLGIIKNALPVINISPFWQLAISGSAIIIAVAVNARAERRKGRVILRNAEQAA